MKTNVLYCRINIDLKQAILECLADFFDISYDGTYIPDWVTVMVEVYAVDDGILCGPDAWSHIEKDIVEYKEGMKRYKEELRGGK